MLTGECSRVFAGHDGPVTGVCATEDDEVFTVSEDNKLMMWLAGPDDDTSSEMVMKPERTFFGHTETVHCVVSIGGGVVCTGAADKTMRMWNVDEGECEAKIDFKAAVLDMSVTDDMLYTAAEDGGVQMWDLSSGERVTDDPGLSLSKSGVPGR